MTVKQPSIEEWINEQVTMISQSELSKEYLEVILHCAYEKGQVAGVDSCLEKIRNVETEIVKKEVS